MKSNNAKIQHYVPKFYLKNFANNKNKVHVFSKKDNNNFLSNIRNIASENFFMIYQI